LQLDCPEGGRFRLTRWLARADGLRASVQVAGPRPDVLLEWVESVSPEQHFQWGAGFVIARSYDLGLAVSAEDGSASTPPPLILSEGVAQVDGLKFTLRLMEVRGTSGDIVLDAASGDGLDLPEDLLAVLGWNWAPLQRQSSGWTSKLRLRGLGPQRSRKAEAAIALAAGHLARVMAEAPSQFHQRHGLARWGVVFRRAIPSLTAVGLIVTALLLPRLIDGEHSGLMMALHYVPIAVLALSFSLQEMARFEIPPWPRQSNAANWRRPPRTGR
jgi:hypothetical protein